MNKNIVISFLRQRKYIGVLAFLLPILLIFIVGIQDSISISYYTKFRDIFVGIINVIGLFFIIDKGYDIKDTISNKIAGICCLIISYCPCESNYKILHIIAAFILFFDLGYISMYLFTKTNKEDIETNRKLIRNDIYTLCGLIIFLNLMIICYLVYFNLHIFIPESLCLFAFSFSWSTKGGLFFKDKI